jgi:hypothetical protein
MSVDNKNFDQFDVMVKDYSAPMKLKMDLDGDDDLFGTTTNLSKNTKLDVTHDDPDDVTAVDDDLFSDISDDDSTVLDDTNDDSVDDTDTTTVSPKKDDKKKVDTKDPKVDDVSDLGDYESDIAKFVSEKLSERLGESLGDFEKVEDIVDKLAEIVESNSTPEFANEEIEKLDKFVRDGGDLRKYYEEIYETSLKVSDLDLSDIADQKRVIKQNLKNSGYTDTQIKRKLDRLEDAGVLQEEAEEAAELVEEFDRKKEEKLLKAQENVSMTRQKEQQKFVSDVQSTIKDLKEIAGIPISDIQRKELLRYTLVFGKDGKTEYQSEYDKDIAKNFIMSAFFQKYNNSLLKKVEKQGASSLAKELQQRLAQKGKRIKKSTGQSDAGDMDGFDAFSKQLRRS